MTLPRVDKRMTIDVFAKEWRHLPFDEGYVVGLIPHIPFDNPARGEHHVIVVGANQWKRIGSFARQIDRITGSQGR